MRYFRVLYHQKWPRTHIMWQKKGYVRSTCVFSQKHLCLCITSGCRYLRGLPDGRIYPLTGTRRPEKGLPDNKITLYFSKTPKAARAVHICELYRTHRRQGKITRTPKKPQHANRDRRHATDALCPMPYLILVGTRSGSEGGRPGRGPYA